MALMAKLAQWTVYGMYDPRTCEVRYVGTTSRSLGSRLSEHMCRAKAANSPQPGVSEWIRDLRDHGLRPEMRVLLNDLDEGTARIEETKAIYAMVQAGARLLNQHLVRPVKRDRRAWKPAPPRLPIRLDPVRGILVW